VGKHGGGKKPKRGEKFSRLRSGNAKKGERGPVKRENLWGEFRQNHAWGWERGKRKKAKKRTGLGQHKKRNDK